MKQIAVLTHSGTDDNYGQVLQCYALQIYLRQLGYDPSLIKYSSDFESSVEKYHYLKQVLRLIFSYTNRYRRRKYKQLREYQELRLINTELNKKRKFDKFLKEHINICACYDSYEQLISQPPKADIYIVGSDQVWNIDLHNPVSKAWFLKFGNPQTKRIAYAASFGRNISDSEIAILKENLADFNAISLRETEGLSLCKRLGYENSKLVIDPTLLLKAGDYVDITNRCVCETRSYLFLYYLNIESYEEIGWDFIDEFIKEKELDIISVSASGYYPAKDLIPNVHNRLLKIDEWISSIQNAEFVVTNSFHGVAFAILFHRPFVAIPLRNQYSAGNSRIISLLKTLHLEFRLVSDLKNISNIFETKIDWEDVDSRLEKMRVESKMFLLDNLE